MVFIVLVGMLKQLKFSLITWRYAFWHCTTLSMNLPTMLLKNTDKIFYPTSPKQYVSS